MRRSGQGNLVVAVRKGLSNMSNSLSCVVIAGLGVLGIGGCAMDESAANPTSESATESLTGTAVADPITAAAGNFHRIRNRAFDQCITAPNGDLNVVLKLADCDDSDTTQGWAFVSTSSPNVFNIVNQKSGFCMEVNNGTSTPGERVDEFHCNGTAAELWAQSFRVIDGVAYQQYKHSGTNPCLDTVSGRGSQLMQFNCGAGNDAQTWLVQ